MRTTVLLAAAAFAVIFMLVHSLVAPVALKRDGKPSTADLANPPTTTGASAPVSSPVKSRR